MTNLTHEQLAQAIERGAMSMLTDDEIMVQNGIDRDTLNNHYDTITRARINLKQKLNAKRIADAASGRDNLAQLSDMIPRNNQPIKIRNQSEKPERFTKDGRSLTEINRQNAAQGAGRPRGSTNKLTAQTLLQNIADKTGKPFGELLAEGYHEAIQTNDKVMRAHYERMLIGKVVAEQVAVEINDSETVLAAKALVFQQAIRDMGMAVTVDNGASALPSTIATTRAATLAGGRREEE